MNKTASILRRVSRFAPVKRFIFGIIFIMLGLSLYGQTTYPVQVFTQLTPPYTPYLPAYYSGITEKLKVTLINTDMKQPLLSVFLRMKIKSSSFTVETPENVYTERLELQAGVPLQLSLNDLAVYFKNENMRISGGRNEFLRTNMLPDNFYRFNFEVYEANTGRLLSNPKLGFAQAMIASGEPPVLNMPLKGTTIMESNIPSIMFSWTPRHMNSVASAYGTEYEFTLVEIYDKQVSPEAAFDFSRVLYTETIRSTSFIHTVAQPMLIPGMRYAWRVRAVAREGVEEANVFKNNGFSPVSWFDYTVDCKQVQFDKVEVKDRVAIISWQQSGAIDYDVQYRKKGSNKWYTGNLTDKETCPVYNLKFGEAYEYKIGVRCTMNDAFTYTEAKGFRMPEELAKSANCGILPNINVTNQTPARELQAKLPILVGDFPVFITKVTGSGRFTGEGYVGIPYLKNAKIAVTFKDITVNTDNRMIDGFIETKYDISSSGKNLLWDVDQTLTGGKGVGDIRTGEEKAQYIVDYTIDSKLTQVPIKKDTSKDEIKEGEAVGTTSGENERYIITLTDDKGNKQEQVVDKFPATIEDKSGAIYEVDKEGNIKQVSSKSDIKLDDNTKYKQDTTIVAVRFEKTDNTRYALDVYTDIYNKVPEYEREYVVRETEPIRASAKLMLPGTSDELFVRAIVNDQSFEPAKVHFVTEDQTEYKAGYDSKKGGWTLNLVASPANDGQLVYVVYEKAKSQYSTLAILKVLTYEPKEINVMLVPVNKHNKQIDATSIQNEANAIYNKFGVTVNIKVSGEEFNYTPIDGQTFQIDGMGLFATRTADMDALEEAFKKTGQYNDRTVYLFVMDTLSNVPNAVGDMPRDSRMGYLFPSYTARTIAHEIGHGVFNLKHPFAKGILTNQFNEGELKDNLMDYPIGTGLTKLQWDALHAPGTVIGIFEKDKDAMGTENDTPSQYILEAYKRLEKIGELIDENHFVILYSTTCSWAIEKDEERIIEFPLTNVETGLSVGTVDMPVKAKAIEYIYGGRINVAISVNLGDNGWNYNTSSGITISETTKEDLAKIAATTFFGILTKDKVYQCEPPEYPVCDQKNLADDFYALMLTSIAKCIEENEQKASSNKVGDSFFYWAISKYPDIDKDVIRTISEKQDKIADILFKNQIAGNEWENYGEYFEASFNAAVQANNIDNGDYLKRLTEFIRIFEDKLDQLGRMDHEQIALFVGTFTDNELLYLPMNLRIKTMDLLSQSPELKNLLDSQKQSETIVNWAVRENMILKLLERIEPGEEKELLEQLKTSGTIKRINNNLDDFITLVDDDYTKFLDLIDSYVYHVNAIDQYTIGTWFQKLYEDDRVFNISQIDKEGEPFISATGIGFRGEVEIQLKEFNGQYKTETYYSNDGPYTSRIPLYDKHEVKIPYDEPIAIYHNAYLSGVSTDNLGKMQIVSALRAHYYLQKHKDEQTATAIWTAVDVASLAIGVGEISAAVKAASKWRLVLGICNTSSSVGSLLATGLDRYIISSYGKDGEEFIQSLRKVSAILGLADLGVAGIRKFGNMLDDDLVTIGKFHETYSSRMISDSRTKDLEQTVRKLIENYDADLVRAIKNTSQNTDAVLATLRTSYPKLYDKIAYIQESLRKDFLTDFAENAGALGKFNNNPDLLDSWQALNLAKRTGLQTDMGAIESFGRLMQNKRLTQLGMKQGDFADMLKAGWGGEPQIPSFKTFCDEVNQLIDALPNNTVGLNKYLGSSGFTNAQGYTQRHAYTQLQRLFENEDILKNAQSIKFENEISQSAFGIGNSVSDVHIVSGNGTIIEIETKAGMEFFEGLGSSNFMTQSGNSLMTVSRVEDYKVFLNPGLVVDKQIAIKTVVDGWSKQGWFKSDKFFNMIKDYDNRISKTGTIISKSDIESYLRNNGQWFNDIFMNNIK